MKKLLVLLSVVASFQSSAQIVCAKKAEMFVKDQMMSRRQSLRGFTFHSDGCRTYENGRTYVCRVKVKDKDGTHSIWQAALPHDCRFVQSGRMLEDRESTYIND